MQFPDLISMDNDDESPITPTPNYFLLSTYKENYSLDMNQTNLKIILSYNCYLCRRILDNPILTCSKCVNTGQFCSSKHDLCSNKRREILLNMLNKNDYEEFQQNSNNKSMHIQCSDRKFLLKKFNSEKRILQSEFQIKLNSSIKTRQMSQEIQVQKTRLNLINHSIEKLREQIEQKKKINIKTQQCIGQTRSRIETIKKELNKTKKFLKSSNNEIQKKIDDCTKNERILQNSRQERFNEILTYLFPIKRVSAVEDVLATRIKDLLNAQQTIIDETKNDQVENDDMSVVSDYRYQIVNSFLPSNGDYQIDNLVSIYNASDISKSPDADETNKKSEANINDLDSPQLSPSCDSYEVLSALSHACQLINIIAFYLNINLPFRLHQLEFNANNLTIDCLTADIAKLNANIISCCFSQGIPIEFTNVKYTVENILKLLTFRNYRSRPKPVIYPQNYIDIIEKEVNEISRSSITDYWFDDNDDEKELIDILNTFEWELIPQDEYIRNNLSIDEENDSSPSNSTQQNSSTMSSSIGYLKTKSSDFVNSIFRSFRS